MYTDPKRPQKIVYYQHRSSPEDQSDFFQLISMLFGIISFLFKLKWAIWLSLIFFISSYVNMKYNVEQKQLVMNFSLIALGFVMTYFLPNR